MSTQPLPRRESANGVQVIERVGQIMRALYAETQGLSLSQLAERVHLPRSTVQRVVAALVREGLLASASPNGRVRLGPELGRLAASRRELSDDLAPFMEQLHEQFDETVVCSVIDGDMQRCVAQIGAPHRLRTEFPVGGYLPLHCTANGKALLAELSPEEVRRILPPRLPRLTPNTITSLRRLEEHLAVVRDVGVAFDHEERSLGICAAALAVRDHLGSPASICVAVPTERFEGRERELAAAFVALRGDIRQALGTA